MFSENRKCTIVRTLPQEQLAVKNVLLLRGDPL